MSLKLDELRKRLLQQHSQGGNAVPSVDTPASSRVVDSGTTVEPKQSELTVADPSAPKLLEISSTNGANLETAPTREESATSMPARQSTPSMKSNVTQDQLADAVAKVFEETRNFESRLDELRRMFSLVEQVGGSAEELFGPLRTFHGQLSQLARSFEPMRAFQTQLAQMAETFEPMKVLHDQLAQVADSFKEHLEQLVRALDPAKEFRERILRLAAIFDQASELQGQFRDLYSAFNASGGDADAHATGGNGRRATLH
jgi:ABC-type transporter Mla subunit MlaD